MVATWDIWVTIMSTSWLKEKLLAEFVKAFCIDNQRALGLFRASGLGLEFGVETKV